ncbi:UPF0146 family protein [Halalkaliarchaeum desulfuricum]|uniref:UPF0146 family protein n=1 Tax=Halalkaliarchaeum desulfuricum TaxID=2055893 RepID=UPI000E6B8340|nr:UPF0146 family protein [Halalkaliarchaeum desulfuricum]
MTVAPDGELADRLAGYDSLLEVGVGRRPGVAAALADAGCRVVAIDVDPDIVAVARAETPAGVTVIQADVVSLADRKQFPSEYDVDAVYARNLPAELQRPSLELARRVGADLLFTTLGFEAPVIPVERDHLDGGVLYVVRQ